MLGSIRPAIQLGFKGTAHYIWCACNKCGKERWVRINSKQEPINKYCRSCSSSFNPQGSDHPRFKNARMLDTHGYVFITINKNDPYISMCGARHKYSVAEHRYVMRKVLAVV